MHEKHFLTSTIGVITTAVGTALQPNEILEIISLILTIVGTIITFIVIPLINWFRKSKEDGKIDSKEIVDAFSVIGDGIQKTKDCIDNKSKKED